MSTENANATGDQPVENHTGGENTKSESTSTTNDLPPDPGGDPDACQLTEEQVKSVAESLGHVATHPNATSQNLRDVLKELGLECGFADAKSKLSSAAIGWVFDATGTGGGAAGTGA